MDYQGNVLRRINGSEVTDPSTGYQYVIEPMGMSLGSYRTRLGIYPGSTSLLFTAYPVAKVADKEFSGYYAGIEMDVETGAIKFVPVKYGDLPETVNREV